MTISSKNCFIHFIFGKIRRLIEIKHDLVSNFFVILPRRADHQILTNLLSMIIQNVTGRSYGDFFNADIASVIGVAPLSWEDIPGGFTKGAAGASVGARDLARIAYLTLQNGVWDSGSGAKQIVTAANLEKATQWAPFLANSEFRESPGSPFPLPADAPNHYGYLWWTNRTQIALGSDIPTDAYYMHGFRDNLAIETTWPRSRRSEGPTW